MPESPLSGDSRLPELFAAALPLSAEARTRFLLASCPDVELRRLIEELLQCHDRPPEFLDRGLLGVPVLDFDSESTPKHLGPFRVLELLGNGGMGVVYRAEQAEPRREVAVQVLVADALVEEARDRFRRAAEIHRRLRHPGIAQVFAADVEDTRTGAVAWLAMEPMHGRRLGEAALPALGEPRGVCELVAKIADAVQYAHEQGVVHRHLRPANILVIADGNTLHPKVLDFGIADAFDGALGNAAAEAPGSDRHLDCLPYLSPEQVRGTAVGPAADIWALGVITYELLAGRLPLAVADPSVDEAMRRFGDRQPTPLRRVRADLHQDLETIVAVAMHEDAKHRYPSAAAFAADLRRFLANEPIAATAPVADNRPFEFVRRHRGLVLGIGSTLLFAVVAALVQLCGGERAKPASEALPAREARDRRYRELRFENYRSDMALALAAARSADGSARLEALLTKWEPSPDDEDLRGFEWYLLRSFAGERHRLLPTPGEVHTLRWHPRHAELLVGGHGFAWVLDAERGTVRQDLGLDGEVRGGRWSPDGRQAAMVAGNQLRIIDLAAPQHARSIELVDGTPPPTTAVMLRSVAWLADGQRVVAIGSEGQAWSVEPSSGATTAFWRERDAASEPDVQPHTDRIALAEGFVDGRSLTMLHAHDGFQAATNRWDRSGERLAITIHGRIAILDAAGRVRVRHEQPQGVVATTWSPDGRQLATMAGHGMVQVFDVNTWRETRMLPSGHHSEGVAIDWSPDGRWLATGGRSPHVELIDLAVPAPIRTVQPSRNTDGPFGGVQWHPRDRALVVRWSNQTLICDPDTGSVTGRTGGWLPTWSPDGSQQAWFDGDDVVVRLADGSRIRQTLPREPTWSTPLLSWTADGQALLIRVRGQLWFWPFGAPAHPLTCTGAGAIACAPRGTLACVTTENALCLVDPWRDRVVTTCRVQDHPRVVAWSPDASGVAVLSESAAIALRDGKTLALRRELIGGDGPPTSVCWQPDGKRIAAAARGGLWLWDPDSAEPTARMPGLPAAAFVAFSPDGQELALMSDTGEVIVYDTRVGRRRASQRR